LCEAFILVHKRSNGSDYDGPALSIGGLRKTFGDVIAVDHLDLEVTRGECFELLGPNGAGKPTTIEICEGLTPPDAGSVKLLGLGWKTAERELRQRIGIQLQETQFPDKLTVQETLRLFRSFFHRGISTDEAIRIAQLEEKRTARVDGLSGGQKQRLAMACALVGDPELLFLDEPTTGLDPQARRHLWDLVDELKRAGRTIILTTHYKDEAERLCDRVAIMDHGRIIALGTPQQLIASVGGDHIVEFAVTKADATRGTHDLSGLCRWGGYGAFALLLYSLGTLVQIAVIGMGAPPDLAGIFAMLQDHKIEGLLRLDLPTILARPLYYLIFLI